MESTTPPGSPQRSGATAVLPSTSGAGLAETTISPSKRRYVSDAQDVEVVKKIKQNEVELRDRNTVLRGTKANVSTPECDNHLSQLIGYIQNFSAIRTAYTEKLKKLRDNKPGAPVPSVASSSGWFPPVHACPQMLTRPYRPKGCIKEIS